MMKKQFGFSLIELIIFIVLTGIALAIFIPLAVSLMNIHQVDRQTQAVSLAQKRIELILEQKKLIGFDNFTDPCTSNPQPDICTVPSGFTINSTIENNWEGNFNFKMITVTVSGQGHSTLKTLVANY